MEDEEAIADVVRVVVVVVKLSREGNDGKIPPTP
jgi:hypothetical protein